MHPPYTTKYRGLPGLVVAALLLGLIPHPARSQEPALGLRAIGAASLSLAVGRVDRGATGIEGGAALDLGHFASRRIRVGVSAAFLRTLPFTEYVAQDDTSFRDVFYDLSGHVSLTFLARRPEHRVVPWASIGAGVHVLTSSFGSIPIDIRYNTNVFGLRSAAGVRLRGARRALSIEAGAILAKEVSRATLGLSTEWLFGDLRNTPPR